MSNTEERIYYVVYYGVGKLAVPVTTSDNGITIELADPGERLTEEEARERLQTFSDRHGIPFFHYGMRSAPYNTWPQFKE